jgi:putative ABC transport system permease protein
MGAIFQMRFSLGSLELGAAQAVAYVVIGTAGAFLAAFVPARKASRLDPLELMRPDFRERLAIASPTRLLLGVVVLLLGAIAVAVHLEHTRRSIGWGNVASALGWLTTVVLAIPVMTGITAVLRRILPRLFGFEGRVAAESLTRSPGRTGVTAAVIALSLALTTTVASISESFRESQRNWFILVGDLVVSAVSTEGGWLETPLDVGMGDRLARIPGVQRVETYRVLTGQPYREGRIAVVGVSPGFVETPLFRRQIRDGDADGAVRAVAAGEGIVVSDSLAERFGVTPGEEVELATPRGPRRFPVVAVVAADYSGDQGSVVVARDVLVALWGDARVSHFNVFLAPDADARTVRERITGTLGRDHLLKVLTTSDALGYLQGMVDRALAFTYAVQLLMVAVTLAGTFDLLATQMTERRREIGVLRALGAEAASVRRAIRLEAAVIGVVGALEGALLGMATSFLWVRFNFRILIGYVLEHHLAVGTAFTCVVLAGAFAIVAGQLAARSTLRAPVLDALRYE